MTRIPLWTWWVAAVLLYAAGEVVSKRWGNSTTWNNGTAVMAVYTVSTMCWLGIMAHTNKLVLMSTIWQAVGAVISALVGCWVFGEQLTATQWLGFAMVLAAGVLLGR